MYPTTSASSPAARELACTPPIGDVQDARNLFLHNSPAHINFQDLDDTAERYTVKNKTLEGNYEIVLPDNRRVIALFKDGLPQSGGMVIDSKGVKWSIRSLGTTQHGIFIITMTEQTGTEVGIVSRNYDGEVNLFLQKHGAGIMRLKSGARFVGQFLQDVAISGYRTIVDAQQEIGKITYTIMDKGDGKEGSQCSYELKRNDRTTIITGLYSRNNSIFNANAEIRYTIDYSRVRIEMTGCFAGSLEYPIQRAKFLQVLVNNEVVIAVENESTWHNGQFTGCCVINKINHGFLREMCKELTLFAQGGIFENVVLCNSQAFLQLILLKTTPYKDGTTGTYLTPQEQAQSFFIPEDIKRKFFGVTILTETNWMNAVAQLPSSTHPGLLYSKGMDLLSKQDLCGLALVSQAANLNYPDALAWLGNFYIGGAVSTSNIELGYSYINQLINMNCPGAMIVASTLPRFNKLEYLSRAAKMNHPIALYELACLYGELRIRGNEIYPCFLKSASMDNARALYAMTMYYINTHRMINAFKCHQRDLIMSYSAHHLVMSGGEEVATCDEFGVAIYSDHSVRQYISSELVKIYKDLDEETKQRNPTCPISLENFTPESRVLLVVVNPSTDNESLQAYNADDLLKWLSNTTGRSTDPARAGERIAATNPLTRTSVIFANVPSPDLIL